jgi:dihydroorotate dehydrogenase
MIYRSLLRPLLFQLPSETAHEIALHTISTALNTGMARKLMANHCVKSPFGLIKRFGLSFINPVGLAAGFDKNGIAASAMAALGFGFVEVGTVTRLPQPGNPKPRLFRLPLDRALINRAGFNNDGAEALVKRLENDKPDCVLGINIGKSRIVEIEDSIPDYLSSFETVFPLADYIVVNVSSPNTPRLRELQHADVLKNLLEALQTCNRDLTLKFKRKSTVPLLLKIAPDLNNNDIESIVEVATNSGLAGIIATNTTTSRNELKRTPQEVIAACGEGGVSGNPLRRRSTEVIAHLYNLTNGCLPIVGVGGIFSAADAWEKIAAGASLVQLYTGLIYEGLGIAKRINEGLAEILHKEGFRSFDEAVGYKSTEVLKTIKIGRSQSTL